MLIIFVFTQGCTSPSQVVLSQAGKKENAARWLGRIIGSTFAFVYPHSLERDFVWK